MGENIEASLHDIHRLLLITIKCVQALSLFCSIMFINENYISFRFNFQTHPQLNNQIMVSNSTSVWIASVTLQTWNERPSLCLNVMHLLQGVQTEWLALSTSHAKTSVTLVTTDCECINFSNVMLYPGLFSSPCHCQPPSRL